MNHRVEKLQPLLDQAGHLNEPGYAFHPVFDYSREQIKASPWRIKEWDYYAAINDDFAVAFTIADLGYMGMLTATYLDFKSGKETKKTFMRPFTFGRFHLPNQIDTGDIDIVGKTYHFHVRVGDGKRHIHVRILRFVDDKDLSADLTLEDLHDEHMVIATPWKEKPKAFYYNQKINCMPTAGEVFIGEEHFIFDPLTHFSVLDWGRGVWTYKNTWYWGSLSGMIQGKRFGFNIGYGFGDTSKATENMLFYDGKAHKLDQVTFHMDDDDIMKTWRFTSNDHRLELEMTPLLDRVDHTNLWIIKNFGHQVWGRFNGCVTLDDGTRLEVKDMIGFAEKITNHY